MYIMRAWLTEEPLCRGMGPVTGISLEGMSAVEKSDFCATQVGDFVANNAFNSGRVEVEVVHSS